MGNRLSLLRALRRRHCCTHVLLSDPVDCEYLSGFRSSDVHLLVCADECFLLTDFRYRDAAEAHCRDHRPWKFVEIKEQGFSYLRDLAPGRARIGFQSNAVSVDQYDRMRRCCPQARFVKLSRPLAELFVPKTRAEIALMRKAARIGDRAWASLQHQLVPGMEERLAARLLEESCAEFGSEKPSFDTIVLFGARSALPHGVPSRARLRRGDWILADFGCTVGGLCSDMTRTCVAGKATERQKQVYEVVRAAQAAACGAVRAGVGMSQVDATARAVISQAGYGRYFGHATGHGVGRRIHEPPRLSRKARGRLQSGSVVTVEPGIYISEFGGVRIEDMVVVKRDKPEILTHSPRHLMELSI